MWKGGGDNFLGFEIYRWGIGSMWWTWPIDMFIVGFLLFGVWKWWQVNGEIYNHEILKKMMHKFVCKLQTIS
jgi:hypothetical protein